MDALEAIETRTSVAALVEPGPTDAQWAGLLRAGARAPDHGRLRPWRFLIIRGDARRRLGDALAGALLTDQPDAAPETVERERRKPLRAPAILVVAAIPSPHAKAPEIEQILAAGAATQNILLAAHAMGLGAIWRTGAPAYDRRVIAALGLPPEAHIVAFVYLGTPASEPRRRDAEPVVATEWGEIPRDFEAL
ncbi:nitroreductase family protein [Methylocystis parvus]|uniref:Putative NAD(P)H nitroreductase n=1 Tax=Methylocystis parvus TaxID=134 RepID=A0A6B8M8V2_9HYPH|nr:nitroreductase [Methylocystis parvus]QGM97733.1 nitroreductase [Methylocystis parvus]WBK01964.1 nitroreductase [Methylocystis parvus OBBP]